MQGFRKGHSHERRFYLLLVIYLSIIFAVNGCGKPKTYYMELATILENDKNCDRKEHALSEFGKIGNGDIEALPALIYLFDNSEWGGKACYWANYIGEDAIPILLAALNNASVSRKINIIKTFKLMATKDIKVKKKLIEMLQDKDCRVAILAQDCLAEMGSTKEVPDSTYRYIINNEEFEYITIAIRELWRKKRNKTFENIVLEIMECEDEYRMYSIIDRITPRVIRSKKIKNKMKKAIENGEIEMECVKKRMKDYIREYEHDDKKHKKSIKFDTENAEKN